MTRIIRLIPFMQVLGVEMLFRTRMKIHSDQFKISNVNAQSKSCGRHETGRKRVHCVADA
ncbi:hypothetical protein Mapa_009674 [Marchantia paleacea]|nr:hypothetical protein Mapa_009674 [Marchantia paleacea]